MDELRDLYNQSPSFFSPLSDPFTIKKPASWAAYNEYGDRGEVGGDTDALRHLLGAATLAKRQGSGYAETALNWHENPNIPQFLGGGYGQREGDRAMDLHNNKLGMEIAQKAKTYDEALGMAKKYIKEGKVKYSKEDYSKPVSKAPSQPDVIDQIFSNPVDLVRSMFTPK
jgi:hypothetical protein